MNEDLLFMSVWLLLCVLVFTIYLIYLNLKNPFQYPYFEYTFDITGKRKPEIEDLIDRFLIEDGIHFIDKHMDEIEEWKRACKYRIQLHG